MRLLPLLLLAAFCLPIQAQQVELSSPALINAPSSQETKMEVRGDSFRSAMTKAIRSAVKKGELTRVKGFRLRLALLSPAFQKHAEDLAVIQMAFSDDADVLPFDADGKIQRANIDWDSFLAFLEKLIPLILQLIELFGA